MLPSIWSPISTFAWMATQPYAAHIFAQIIGSSHACGPSGATIASSSSGPRRAGRSSTTNADRQPRAANCYWLWRRQNGMEESERYRQLLNEKQRDRGLLLQARARIFAPSISKRGSKQFSTSAWPATAYVSQCQLRNNAIMATKAF